MSFTYSSGHAPGTAPVSGSGSPYYATTFVSSEPRVHSKDLPFSALAGIPGAFEYATRLLTGCLGPHYTARSLHTADLVIAVSSTAAAQYSSAPDPFLRALRMALDAHNNPTADVDVGVRPGWSDWTAGGLEPMWRGQRTAATAWAALYPDPTTVLSTGTAAILCTNVSVTPKTRKYPAASADQVRSLLASVVPKLEGLASSIHAQEGELIDRTVPLADALRRVYAKVTTDVATLKGKMGTPPTLNHLVRSLLLRDAQGHEVTVAIRPDTPYLIVSVVGSTHKGAGSVAMERICAIADKLGMPIFLEAVFAGLSFTFYAKYGFGVALDEATAGNFTPPTPPYGGVGVTTVNMVRLPRPRADGGAVVDITDEVVDEVVSDAAALKAYMGGSVLPILPYGNKEPAMHLVDLHVPDETMQRLLDNCYFDPSSKPPRLEDANEVFTRAKELLRGVKGGQEPPFTEAEKVLLAPLPKKPKKPVNKKDMRREPTCPLSVETREAKKPKPACDGVAPLRLEGQSGGVFNLPPLVPGTTVTVNISNCTGCTFNFWPCAGGGSVMTAAAAGPEGVTRDA